ncbi:MAG: hypothetical protein CFH41_01221 [Alphaproteobacteria bacterium MarineAlpha11_Bin1]|nr:MAG: hypothetical protein CFH41_01221 [Alphaproteobacteria bacterium MarineAlpha11_Bin1]|tara:strand:+ start:3005 stop:3403 length:399 start_codon:yes stop_codon:yes gene_type:complete
MTISKPKVLSDRKFGLIFAVSMAMLYGALWLLLDLDATGLLIAAGIFAFIALLVPGILLPINRLWMSFAGRLAGVNNHIILGTIFVFVITPLGMFMRLLGRDPIARKIDRNAGSYLVPVERQTDADTMRDIF